MRRSKGERKAGLFCGQHFWPEEKLAIYEFRLPDCTLCRLHKRSTLTHRALHVVHGSIRCPKGHSSLVQIEVEFGCPQHERVGEHVPAKHEVQVPEPDELRLVLEHGVHGVDVLGGTCKRVDLGRGCVACAGMCGKLVARGSDGRVARVGDGFPNGKGDRVVLFPHLERGQHVQRQVALDGQVARAIVRRDVVEVTGHAAFVECDQRVDGTGARERVDVLSDHGLRRDHWAKWRPSSPGSVRRRAQACDHELDQHGADEEHEKELRARDGRAHGMDGVERRIGHGCGNAKGYQGWVGDGGGRGQVRKRKVRGGGTLEGFAHASFFEKRVSLDGAWLCGCGWAEGRAEAKSLSVRIACKKDAEREAAARGSDSSLGRFGDSVWQLAAKHGPSDAKVMLNQLYWKPADAWTNAYSRR
ncbi:hypothetical protein L1887_56463 [Cichorium endivia]|nr:hypothetical protein L1887_56463 [Cichorium endivia]